MANARLRYMLLALACVSTAVSRPAAAQTKSKPAPKAAAATSAVDPEAVAALDRMSAALQAIGRFSVKSDATTEIVLEDGQKIQFGGRVDLKVVRPNAFRIAADADTQTREMYYNGKTFTIYAPRLGYYASFDAPPTIRETLEKARGQYALEVPLADLFTWGTDQRIRARVQQAMVVRPERIDDRTCMHYAFRQAKVDWQIWIDQGARPLPCKLVITNTDDPAQPQYSAVLHWDLDTSVTAAELAFTPPDGARRIAITDAAVGKGEGK